MVGASKTSWIACSEFRPAGDLRILQVPSQGFAFPLTPFP